MRLAARTGVRVAAAMVLAVLAVTVVFLCARPAEAGFPSQIDLDMRVPMDAESVSKATAFDFRAGDVTGSGLALPSVGTGWSDSEPVAPGVGGTFSLTPGLVLNAGYARLLESGAWASGLSAQVSAGHLSLAGYVASVMPDFSPGPENVAGDIEVLARQRLTGATLALDTPRSAAGAEAAYSTSLGPGSAQLTGRVAVSADADRSLESQRVKLTTVTELVAATPRVRLTYRVTDSRQGDVAADGSDGQVIGYLVAPELLDSESSGRSARSTALVLDMDLTTAAKVRAGYERVSPGYVMPVVKRESGSSTRVTGEVSARVDPRTSVSGAVSVGKSPGANWQAELSAQVGVRRELSDSASLKVGLAYSTFTELTKKAASGSASVELDIRF